ncbi:MAG TPA: hypothetical protein DD727_05965 [Clostridiales bacterium]|nr:hypothetical protein [Clostridiales bacterium]
MTRGAKRTANQTEGIIRFDRGHRWFYDRGIACAENMKFRKALLFVRKAAQLKPANAEYAFNMAGILAVLKDYRSSNQCLMSLLNKQKSGFPDCYFGLGCNYFDMGKYSSANRYFEKYLRTHPEGAFAMETCKALHFLRTEQLIPNRTEWENIIQLAIKKREKAYGREYPEEIRWMWFHFIYLLMEGRYPVIRKPKSWAAFLEYLYCTLKGFDYSLQNLAEKYEITDTALDRKISGVLGKLRY